MRKTVLVGTREIKHVKVQAQWVINQLYSINNEYRYQLVEVRTKADIYGDCSREVFKDNDDKKIFTEELEEALRKGEIDIAVHRMNDVPYEIEPEFSIAAVVGRSDPSDVLVSHKNLSLDNLPQGAIIGVSSALRKAQLLRFRPDFNIAACRGNIHNRISKVKKKELDAVVVAACDMERLGLEDKITEYLPYSLCMPEAGQGAVAVEIRSDDSEIRSLVEKINNPIVANEVEAERSLVKYLLLAECNLPVGALARYKGKRLHLEAVVLSFDGSKSVRAYATEYITSPERLGLKVANKLLMRGADKILQEVS
ncbi:MAG TPA: hydroxymethylbilane synthase [Peptococcaceae bacterium]|nr:MAG: Porphobilinogen deaminase [Clostridia bacterium 41_269]HBT19901.1 hydroxymethylbilane synthase [Peptococcaceae bacterium]